tara:strand:+ start:786 stop:1019 length:234 start_codon:yes stop_codon:yes gene_type:complete
MANCINCEEDYSDKRLALGYETCLNCGESEARAISHKRAHAKLCEMTPYISGSLSQPDALFDPRGNDRGYGSNNKPK